jgi:hypothetical protein
VSGCQEAESQVSYGLRRVRRIQRFVIRAYGVNQLTLRTLRTRVSDAALRRVRRIHSFTPMRAHVTGANLRTLRNPPSRARAARPDVHQ